MRSLYTRIFSHLLRTLFLAFRRVPDDLAHDRPRTFPSRISGTCSASELSLAQRIYREQGRDALAEFLNSADAFVCVQALHCRSPGPGPSYR